MLYLTRKAGQAVIINNDIEVRVVGVRANSVKLGFTFPASASVLREEVFEQVRAENLAAARLAASLPKAVPGDNGQSLEAEADTAPAAPPRTDEG